MTPGEGTVRLEQGDRRATLTLDHPPLNVLDLEMLEALQEALTLVEARDDCCVLLLAAAGPIFSAGVDVKDHTADRVEAMLRTFHGALWSLLELGMVTVARIQGRCLGGGLELAMACDLVYASEEAMLGQPEIALAAFPPFGAALYPRLLGGRTAADLVLRGEAIPAPQARDLGLLTDVFPREELAERVDAVCRQLEGYSAAALRLAKKALRAGLHGEPRGALAQAERIYLEELMETEDAHEGLAAFLEKRRPVWRDR